MLKLAQTVKCKKILRILARMTWMRLFYAVAYLGFPAPGDKSAWGPHPARSWQHRWKELAGSKGASNHIWLFLDPSENFT